MLQAFVDDSGSGQGAVFVLAGFIASAEQWAAFKDEWKESLGGAPYFKMADAEKLFGRTGKDDRVTRFYRIIENHAVAGVSSAVMRDDYERVFGRAPQPMRDPYFLLFFDLIAQLSRNQKKLDLHDKVDFIFDEQLGKKEKVIAAWDSFKSMGQESFGHILGDTPSFKDDKEILPLQAADLYAWWIRRQIEEDTKGMARTPFPWKIKREIPGLAVRWREENLQQVYDLLFGQEIPPEVLLQLGLPLDFRLRPLDGE